MLRHVGCSLTSRLLLLLLLVLWISLGHRVTDLLAMIDVIIHKDARLQHLTRRWLSSCYRLLTRDEYAGTRIFAGGDEGLSKKLINPIVRDLDGLLLRRLYSIIVDALLSDIEHQLLYKLWCKLDEDSKCEVSLYLLRLLQGPLTRHMFCKLRQLHRLWPDAGDRKLRPHWQLHATRLHPPDEALAI